jgi:hypothetical protein
VILRLTDLDSGLEGGLFNPPKKVPYAGTRVYASVTISLEVLHLLVYLFMAGNICLKVAGLILASVLEVT